MNDPVFRSFTGSVVLSIIVRQESIRVKQTKVINFLLGFVETHFQSFEWTAFFLNVVESQIPILRKDDHFMILSSLFTLYSNIALQVLARNPFLSSSLVLTLKRNNER